MFDLTISARLLSELREILIHGAQPIELPLGVRRHAAGVEFVAPATRANPLTAPGSAPRLRVGLFSEHLRGATHLYWHAYPIPPRPAPQVDLALFAGDGCSAAVLHQGRAWPLERVRVLGAGMTQWQPGMLLAPLPSPAADAPFSRYVEPLGGPRALRDLHALRIGVVGCSRLGSLLCGSLARVGVRDLTLIDPDVVEAHHLDAIDVPSPAWLGKPKVEAVAALLCAAAPGIAVTTLMAPVAEPRALTALAACDVIVTAPDRAQPRLLGSLCAVAYGRVHLDLGTGVLRRAEPPAPRPRLEFGADLRLVLPGHCLLCLGGVEPGPVDLSPVEPSRAEPTAPDDWRSERAGSLRSLNGVAAAYALFLLERLVSGDLTESTWTRLRLDARAHLQVERPTATPRRGCPVCADSGRGDAVWPAEPEPPRATALAS